MTLPASGPMTMGQIAFELGLPSTGLSLDHGWVRALAGVLSGAISFSNLYSKTGRSDGTYATSNLGGTLVINPPGTLFGGALQDYQGGAGGPSYIFFSSPSSWTGNFRVTNNSTGQSVVCTRVVSTQWDGPTTVLRDGATADSITITPA